MSVLNDELKAVVLCAGEGTRLRPLTFSKPKHLLPVAGKPLLGYVLEALAAAGLREVGLVVRHRADAVESYVGDGSRWGLQVSYITQNEPRGLAHAIKQAQDFVAGSPFVVYLGDNLLEDGIEEFVDGFRTGGCQAALLLKQVEDPRRFGVAVLDGSHQVQRLVEKPQQPPSDLAIIGVYAFQPVIFDAIDSIQPSARGELEITDAIQYLVQQGHPVTARIVTGFWEDAGYPASLLAVNRRFLDTFESKIEGTIDAGSSIEGVVCVGAGTRIINSRLVGPCLIGCDCVIEKSVIGPYTSTGDGCRITDSSAEDTIIQDECSLSHVTLRESVVGERVEIVGTPDLRRPLEMIVGDLAQIKVT